MIIAKLQASIEEPVDGQGIYSMFDFLLNPRGELRFVAVTNRNTTLDNRWATIKFLSNKVHGGAMIRVASLDSAFVRVKARVFW